MTRDHDGAANRPHDPRYCRTHAMVADLFAKSSIYKSSAEAWEFNASAWARLAELKERELACDDYPRGLFWRFPGQE